LIDRIGDRLRHLDRDKLELAARVAFYTAVLLFVFRRIFFPGDEPTVFFGWDTLDAYWPDFAFRFQSLWQGEFPLWNPYEHGGMPNAGRTQTMLFYPPSWLLGLFALPDGRLSVWGMQLFILAHFLVLALGSHALARRLGAGRAAAYVAGLTVILAAPVLSQRNSNFLYPTAWLPWLLLALDRLLARPDRLRALAVALFGVLAGSAASPPGVFNVAWGCALFGLPTALWYIARCCRRRPRGTGGDWWCGAALRWRWRWPTSRSPICRRWSCSRRAVGPSAGCATSSIGRSASGTCRACSTPTIPRPGGSTCSSASRR
jgi:hypothetical protein